MISTGNGDKGHTYIFGNSTPIPKNSPVIKKLGELDELNSFLGLCRAISKKQEKEKNLEIDSKFLSTLIYEIQSDISEIEAEIAGADKKLKEEKLENIDNLIKKIEKEIPENSSFVVYGDTELSAYFDVARAVCRRVERKIIENIEENENKITMKYINRLSDLLYLMARFVEFKECGK